MRKAAQTGEIGEVTAIYTLIWYDTNGGIHKLSFSLLDDARLVTAALMGIPYVDWVEYGPL